MGNLYGTIDLTKLGAIINAHPELVRTATMKDGSVHKFIGIDVWNNQNGADQFGNVASMKVSCKKDSQKQGVNYYIANLKESQFQQQQQPQQGYQPTQAGGAPVAVQNDLPF